MYTNDDITTGNVLNQSNNNGRTNVDHSEPVEPEAATHVSVQSNYFPFPNLSMNPITPPVYHRNPFQNISSIGMMGQPLITQPIVTQFSTLPFDYVTSPFPVLPDLMHSSFINPFGGLLYAPMATSVIMNAMLDTPVPTCSQPRDRSLICAMVRRSGDSHHPSIP